VLEVFGATEGIVGHRVGSHRIVSGNVKGRDELGHLLLLLLGKRIRLVDISLGRVDELDAFLRANALRHVREVEVRREGFLAHLPQLLRTKRLTRNSHRRIPRVRI